MNSLLSEPGGFGTPWLLLALVALALIALEGERAWTRVRRGRGLQPGAIAYLLDGLAVTCALLLLALVVTLVGRAIMAILALIGAAAGLDESELSRSPLLLIGLIGVGIAVLAVVARARRGDARQQRALGGARVLPAESAAMLPVAGAATTAPLAAPPAAVLTGASPHARSPTMASASPPARSPTMASPAEHGSAYVPTPQEGFGEQALPSLSMYQERWKPAAPPPPASFLGLSEPASASSAARGRRSTLARALLMLALVAMLVGGAVIFRQQVIAMLAEMALVQTPAAGDGTASAGQPATDGQNVSAHMGAAAGESGDSASGPTSQPVPQAQPAAAAAPAPGGAQQGEIRHVKSVTLDVRSQPGTDQDVVAVLVQGDTVTLLNDTRELQGTIWVKVRFGDREGWVSQAFLE